MLAEALRCATCWDEYAGDEWEHCSATTFIGFTRVLIEPLRVRIEVATTPAHAESFARQVREHLDALERWESEHPLQKKPLGKGKTKVSRRGYEGALIFDSHGGFQGVSSRTPPEMFSACTALASLFGEWVNRLATPAERVELGIISLEAWNALREFRRELLTNPRDDSGVNGYWSRWVGTMQRWLEGGGDWGKGYYGDGHRVTTPDCAVCLRTVKGKLHGMIGSGEVFQSCEGDDQRSKLFPPDATYFDDGYMIDWAKPFPPIGERGPLIEWVESWIDRITIKLTPVGPIAPAVRTILFGGDYASSRELARAFRELEGRYREVRNSPSTDAAANTELFALGDRGGRLFSNAARLGIAGFLDLTPPLEGWIPPFDPRHPSHQHEVSVGFESAWASVLLVEAKLNPTRFSSGDSVGGMRYELHHYDPVDGESFGIHHAPPEHWRQWASDCAALCAMLAERCDVAADKVERASDAGEEGDVKPPTPPASADAIDEHDVAILAFLNQNPSLRRKVSDVLPETGPGDRKAIAKRLRRLADRTPPLVDYPKGQHGKVAILPAGIAMLKRVTAKPPQ